MMIDIYLTSTLLFAGLAATCEKKRLGKTGVFPAIFLLIVTGMQPGYSQFSVIKLAFISYAVAETAAYRADEMLETGIGLLLFILSLFITYTSPFSAELLSIALSVVAVFVFAFDLIAYRDRERTEHTQANAILVCGALVCSASRSFHSQYFGIAILCIHLLVKVYFNQRHRKNRKEEASDRLNQLEYQFNRQVEHEARKLSRGMENKVEEIEEKSMRDPLTRVPNRAMIEKKMLQLMEESMFSIALIDLDDFKKINDTWGHVTGDQCLLNLTEFFMKNKRKADIIGRFGGDEFILLMPRVNAGDAVKMLEYHRKIIEDKSNPHITITVGIAGYPYDGESIEALIQSADRSLYAAKSRGKNQVVYLGEKGSGADLASVK